MKKNFFSYVLAVCFLIPCLLLAACGEDPKYATLKITSPASSSHITKVEYGDGTTVDSSSTSYQSLSYEKTDIKEGETYIVKITYATGFDANSVTVTEATGKSVATKVETLNPTTANMQEQLVITINGITGVYDLTISTPGIEVISKSINVTSYSSNAVASAEADNTYVFKSNGIATKLSEIASTDTVSFSVLEDYYVYLRFGDETYKNRLPYTTDVLNGLVKLGTSNTAFTYDGWKQVPGTTEYAYAFKLDKSNIATMMLASNVIIDTSQVAYGNFEYEEAVIITEDLNLNFKFEVLLKYENDIEVVANNVKTYGVATKYALVCKGSVKSGAKNSISPNSPYAFMDVAKCKLYFGETLLTTTFDDYLNRWIIELDENALPSDYGLTTSFALTVKDLDIKEDALQFDYKTIAPENASNKLKNALELGHKNLSSYVKEPGNFENADAQMGIIKTTKEGNTITSHLMQERPFNVGNFGSLVVYKGTCFTKEDFTSVTFKLTVGNAEYNSTYIFANYEDLSETPITGVGSDAENITVNLTNDGYYYYVSVIASQMYDITFEVLSYVQA